MNAVSIKKVHRVNIFRKFNIYQLLYIDDFGVLRKVLLHTSDGNIRSIDYQSIKVRVSIGETKERSTFSQKLSVNFLGNFR